MICINCSHRGARLGAEYASGVGWRQLKTVLIILAVMSVTACGQSSTSVSGPAPVGKVVAEIRQSTPRDVEAGFGSIWVSNGPSRSVGFGSIWVSNGPSRSVTRIDPTTDRVIAKIYFDDPPSVLAVSADAIWFTSFPVAAAQSELQFSMDMFGSQTTRATRPARWRRSTLRR